MGAVRTGADAIGIRYLVVAGMNLPDELREPDIYLRHFMLLRYQEFARLGYPRRSAFAVDIARGTVSLPPTLEDDPINLTVGEFYLSLREVDRRILSDYYLPGSGTLKQKAKRIGKSIRSWCRQVARLLWRLDNWLTGHGF